MLAGRVAWPAETAARYRREAYWDWVLRRVFHQHLCGANTGRAQQYPAAIEAEFGPDAVVSGVRRTLHPLRGRAEHVVRPEPSM